MQARKHGAEAPLQAAGGRVWHQARGHCYTPASHGLRDTVCLESKQIEHQKLFLPSTTAAWSDNRFCPEPWVMWRMECSRQMSTIASFMAPFAFVRSVTWLRGLASWGIAHLTLVWKAGVIALQAFEGELQQCLADSAPRCTTGLPCRVPAPRWRLW